MAQENITMTTNHKNKKSKTGRRLVKTNKKGYEKRKPGGRGME